MPIQLGSKGEQVLQWQEFLVAQELLRPEAAHGEFDRETDEATREYQERHDLVSDGVVGDLTLQVARNDGFQGGLASPNYTLLYGLKNAAFQDTEHPSALVHIPPSFTASDLAVVLYLHGIGNNIENVVRRVAISSKYPVADLIGHLERSGRNALLVVPELRYNAATSDPGALGQPGVLRPLFEEIFARLRRQLPGLRVEDIRHTVLISHSGGYRAAASLAQNGGVPVQELYLLDSLYGHEDTFHGYLGQLLRSPPEGLRRRRMVNLYTRSGGTYDLSLQLARQARDTLHTVGGDAKWVYTSDEPVTAASARLESRVIVQRVAVGHSEIPLQFVGRLLSTSALPLRRGLVA